MQSGQQCITAHRGADLRPCLFLILSLIVVVDGPVMPLPWVIPWSRKLHELLVQGQVVPHRVLQSQAIKTQLRKITGGYISQIFLPDLPAFCGIAIEWEMLHDPVIYLCQSHFLRWGVADGQEDEIGITAQWAKCSSIRVKSFKQQAKEIRVALPVWRLGMECFTGVS